MKFSWSTHLLMFLSLETLMSIMRTGLPILVELINLVNFVIIFLSRIFLLRWLLSFYLDPRLRFSWSCSFGFISFFWCYQGLIQEINLGSGSHPNNFLPTEVGAWGALSPPDGVWPPTGSPALNNIWSYLWLRICLILMYLQVKICKSLCLYIVFLRFSFTNLPWNQSWFQICCNSYHICFHREDDIWARLICLHR